VNSNNHLQTSNYDEGSNVDELLAHEHVVSNNRSNSLSSGSTYGIDQITSPSSFNNINQTSLSEDIAISEIIFRFMQLLCENHNHDLQNFLRIQPQNKNTYNLVTETLQFLDCICGSTSGGLGLLGLWINEHNVHLINQALETLTEYCQGNMGQILEIKK
jgi:inositol 1,4,5-triphosphate receptor type 1